MVPRVVDREQRKKEIAGIALDLYAEKGFEGTSISGIARLAGIGKGTIYEYFDSKEQLMISALTAWVETLSRKAEGELEGLDDPVERLKKIVRGIMEGFISDPRKLKLIVTMFHMLITDKTFYARHNMAREVLQGMQKTIVGILQDGVSRGCFRPEAAWDAEKIAMNLLAYLDGIALHHYMSESYFSLESLVDFYLQQLLQSLKPCEADS